MITANGVVVIAVTAMKSGADDYLNKPVSLGELGLLVQRLAAALRRRVRIGPGKNRPRCRRPRPQQTRR
jgi:FixJ family two-component response regulator